MKKYRLATLFKTCLIIVSCFALITACEKEDKVNTDQMGGGDVVLRSFGPCPIQRGAELRIIGVNMDKVESVTLQGCGAVTDIKRISSTEIRIMIPQDAEPGTISLKAGSKQITSVTSLTFNEPIIIGSITPLTIKSGSTLKIEGDYLNLIEEIIFTDDVHVLKADFVSQSRESIEVIVPKEAQTGKIIVSNGADIVPNESGEFGIPIWVYSDEDLIVVLPQITKISPNPIKTGNLLTIEGTDFDLADSLVFEGNVGTRNFVSKTATKIEVNVPANANDGTIKLIAFSGVSVSSLETLTLVAPTISSIAPNPVKNGAVLTVKGTDLDLISTVVFGGDKEGTIADGRTATEIKVTVPKDAVAGNVAFNTLAGQSVQSSELTFVNPVISGITPTTITAGSSITITGTDLDLVDKVIFGGNTEGNILSQSGTSIEVESLPNSLTGIITLVTTNGTEIKSAQEITINSDLPVITSVSNQAKPGTKMTIVGTKLNLVESVIFPDNVKATQYGTRSETLIEVYVPDNAKKGKVTLTLITFDGKEVISPEFTIAGTDPIVDPSLVIEDFENHNGHDATWDNWGGSFDYLTADDGNQYIQVHSGISGWAWIYGCNHQANRGNFPSLADPNNYVLKLDMRVTGSYGAGVMFSFSFSGTWGQTNSLLTAQDNYTTNGDWITVTIPMTDLWDGSAIDGASGDWGMALNSGTIPAGVEISIDNVRFEKK